MARQVQLTDAVQGATGEVATVRWGIDLTNVVTITGAKREQGSIPVTAIDGTFEVTDTPNGVMEWSYGAGDVGESGRFLVQFTATFADGNQATIRSHWYVDENLAADSVAAAALLGVTADQRAALDAANDPSAVNPFATMDDLDALDLTFLGLTDTPATYEGQAGELVRVNAGETAVEFFPSPYALATDLTTHTSNTSNPHSVTAAQVGAQPLDAELGAIAGLTSAADKGIQFTGAGTAGTFDLTAAGRELINDVDAAAQQVTLGLVPGTNVQAYSAKTAAITALTWAANSIILLTGTATAAVQAIAAHVVPFLQSADATAARAAIEAAAAADLTTHTGNTSNPHAVTAAQADAVPTAGGTMSGTLAMADNLITRPVIQDYGEKLNAIGSIGGGSQDVDLTLGNVVSGTVDTSTTTFTFSNPPASGTAGSFTLFLTNGGSQTINWPAAVDWAGGTAPTLTAAGVDVLTFVTLDAGTRWFAFAAGLNMT